MMMEATVKVVAVALLCALGCSKTEAPPGGTPSSAVAAPAPATSGAKPAVVSAMRVLPAADMPSGVVAAGKIDKIVAWSDKNGENLAVFSRTERAKKAANGETSGSLEALHFVAGSPPKVLRQVKDRVDNCENELVVEWRDAALAVTDLDKDGIGELTFAYALNCASDITPATLKLLTVEDGQKYILRGSTFRAAEGIQESMGGEFVVDASFKKAPPEFLENAKKVWAKVRPHTAEDAAKAKRPGASKKAASACVRLAWEEVPKTDPQAPIKGVSGRVASGEGADFQGKMEKFLTLELDKPLCDFGGQSVSEIQLAPQSMTEAEEKKLRAFVGKRVTISGSGSEAATVHDHRPIKVWVETITAL